MRAGAIVAFPAGVGAANLVGSTAQIPAEVEVATDRRRCLLRALWNAERGASTRVDLILLKRLASTIRLGPGRDSSDEPGATERPT